MSSSSKHKTPGMPRLAQKTVQELRVLAKSRGLSGYSKLTKPQLLRLFAGAPPAAARSAPARTPQKTRRKSKTGQPGGGARAKPARAKPAGRTAAGVAGGRAPAGKSASGKTLHRATQASGESEELYFLAPPPEAPPASPMLTLRGQKPGVLHAAWSIDPARAMPLPYLRLRILGVIGHHRGVIDEIPLPDLQGSRYFQLAEKFSGIPLCGEIGYQSTDGRFIVMQRHGDIRMPGRRACGNSDPQWWISEADFRELYQRSGGTAEGAALVWHSSFSSR